MKKCKSADKYNGHRDPTCDSGNGCRECWLKRYQYWDSVSSAAEIEVERAQMARGLAWGRWYKLI